MMGGGGLLYKLPEIHTPYQEETLKIYFIIFIKKGILINRSMLYIKGM